MDTAASPSTAPTPAGPPGPAPGAITITLPAWVSAPPYARIAIVFLAAALRLWNLPLRPPHFDEGVNGWFVDQMGRTGFYRYDPTNYHGPLHFYVLFLFKYFLGRNLWALRLPVVLVGILTVDWLFRFQRFFSPRICAWAALAMAISPGFLYYQRDAIHETWMVFFLVLLFWGLCGLWQEGRRRHLWATAMALSGMVLTKETYVVHLACLVIAVQAVFLLEYVWPSRRALLSADLPEEKTAVPGKKHRMPEGMALFAPFARQEWTALDLLAVIVVGLGAIVFFYSGFGLNFRGLAGLFTTFTPWMHKAKVGEGHNKPFVYWLTVLWRNEPWAIFGLGACLRWLAPQTSDWRLRALAIYALLTYLAYSFIPYKTPWCVISFAWPFFLIAGAALVEIVERWQELRTLTLCLAAGLTFLSSFWAIRLNFFRPTAETGEEYVYVQTFPDANRIVDPLLAYAREDPRNYNLDGVILCGSTYPLPWMLGDFPYLGYYGDKTTPPNFYQADFLLVTQPRVAEAEAGLRDPYFLETVRLRSALDPLNLYLRASLFQHLFPGRSPEFIPGATPGTLPGHQVMPAASP